jgi:hypothetical protein
MSGPAVSSSTSYCAGIHPSTVAMPTPFIIKFLKEISHSIVSIKMAAVETSFILRI